MELKMNDEKIQFLLEKAEKACDLFNEARNMFREIGEHLPEGIEFEIKEGVCVVSENGSRVSLDMNLLDSLIRYKKSDFDLEKALFFGEKVCTKSGDEIIGLSVHDAKSPYPIVAYVRRLDEFDKMRFDVDGKNAIGDPRYDLQMDNNFIESVGFATAKLELMIKLKSVRKI